MKLIHIFSIINMLFLNLLPSVYANASWVDDFKAAKVEAETEGKHILVNFTGSDWCGWCIKLDEEVFSKPAFEDYAARKLVLVKVDFPRRHKQPEALKKQNEKLAEYYGIHGFPTILLLAPDGSLVDRTGYRDGGAEAYVEHIKEMLDQ